VEVCDEAFGVTLGRTTSSADLGGKPPPLFLHFTLPPQMGVRVSERSESENKITIWLVLAHDLWASVGNCSMVTDSDLYGTFTAHCPYLETCELSK
jgi:hypothetical protein